MKTEGAEGHTQAPVPIISLEENQAFATVYQTKAEEFERRAGSASQRLGQVRVDVARAHRNSITTTDAIQKAYNAEYEGREPHYAYLSPILLTEGFTQITGVNVAEAQKLAVLDVGAGSNEFLRFCKEELQIPSEQLMGSDISMASVAIVKRDGFKGFEGRLETLPIPDQSQDLIYLSYFIDYDTDQQATFDAAVRLAAPKGKIVLEGWFPVQPFAFLSSDKNTYSFVTKGNSTLEDLNLVKEAFERSGTQQGRQITVERFVEGQRYVKSHYGFHKLPSHFIVLSVD